MDEQTIADLEERIVSLEKIVNDLLDITYDYGILDEDGRNKILKLQNDFNGTK